MMQGETPKRELLPKWIYHSCVTWKINNIFYRLPDMNNTIESPVFKTNFNVHVMWRLTLCLRKKINQKYVTTVSLRLAESCEDIRDRYIKVALELIDISGHVCGTIKGDNTFSQSQGVNFCFPLIDDKITSYFKEKLTYSGEFTIKCDLFFNTSFSPRWLSVDRNLNCLSIDLDTFYLAGNLTDLVLHNGDSKFYVHSTIVKLRSPHVADELTKTPGKQDVSFKGKCSENDLHHMIRYWYSGNLYYLPKKPYLKLPSFIQEMKQQELKQYLSREEVPVSSTFEKSNISVNWTINDDHYFVILETMANQIVAPSSIEQQSWKLHFYPKGETGDANYISLCVEDEGEIISTRPAYLEIFFKSPKSQEKFGCKNTISWKHSPGRYAFQNYMSHDEFKEKLPYLIQGRTISIECTIEYGTGKSTGDCKSKGDSESKDVSNPESVEAMKPPYEVLADKLKDLLETKEMSDVTLETKDRKPLSVHSAILAARSRYFELLLRNPESDTRKPRVIQVHDIKSEDMKLILKYMYHAEIELDLEVALKLYPAVRKYKIKVLEDLCSEELQKNLSIDYALEVLGMADKSQDSSLKTTYLEFIVKNLGEISMTEKWPGFLNANPKLASEIEERRRVVQSKTV